MKLLIVFQRVILAAVVAALMVNLYDGVPNWAVFMTVIILLNYSTSVVNTSTIYSVSEDVKDLKSR